MWRGVEKLIFDFFWVFGTPERPKKAKKVQKNVFKSSVDLPADHPADRLDDGGGS
jgi:hypothetical protein